MKEEFVIQPNQSLSRCGRHVFLWGVGAVMALITLRLAAMGLWLVVPFMALDMLLLVLAFHWVGAHCQIIERVVIDGRRLSIHHEDTRERRKWHFPLHWVRVDLRQGAHPAHGSRLLIGSHGTWIELASFLTNDERESLAAALNRAVRQTLAAEQPAGAAA